MDRMALLLVLMLLIVPCAAESDMEELYTSDGNQLYLLDNTDPLYQYGTSAFARLAIPHKLVKPDDLGTVLTGDRVLALGSYLDTPIIGALKRERDTMRTFLCDGGFIIVPSQFRGIDGEDVELTYHQTLPGTGDYTFLPVDVTYINSPRTSHNHTLVAPLGNLLDNEIANTLYGSHGSFEGQGTILNDQGQPVLLFQRFGKGGIVLTTFDPDFHTIVDRADWARRLLEEVLLTALRWEGGGNEEERTELTAFLETFKTDGFHNSLTADNVVKGEANWEDRAIAHLAGLESANTLLPPEITSPYDKLMCAFALVDSDPARAQVLITDFQSMETGLRFLRTHVALRASRSNAVADLLTMRKEVYETVDALMTEMYDDENGGVFSDSSKSVKGLEDQVFAYFTLYEAYLASGDKKYKDAADGTLAFILELRDDENGGFRTNGKADGGLLDTSKKVWDQALVMLVLSHRISLGECEYADAIGSAMGFLAHLHADNGGYLWMSNDLAGTERLQAKFLRDHLLLQLAFDDRHDAFVSGKAYAPLCGDGKCAEGEGAGKCCEDCPCPTPKTTTEPSDDTPVPTSAPTGQSASGEVLLTVKEHPTMKGHLERLYGLGYVMKGDLTVLQTSDTGVHAVEAAFQKSDSPVVRLVGTYREEGSRLGLQLEGELIEPSVLDPIVANRHLIAAILTALGATVGYLKLIKRKTLGEENVIVSRSIQREGAYVRITVAVKNGSTFPIGNAAVTLYLPEGFTVYEGITYLSLGPVPPEDSQSAVFTVVVPENGTGVVSGVVTYTTEAGEERQIAVEDVTIG